MNKKIILALLCITMVTSITGCKKEEVIEEPEVVVEEPWKYEYIGKTKAEMAVEDYIVAMMWCEDLTELVPFLNIKNGDLIIMEDFAWFLGKAGLDWIQGSEATILNISEAGQNDNRSVRVDFDNGLTATIDMIIDANGEWKINTREMFIENWQLKIQKDTEPKIDEMDISKYKVRSDSRYETYIIPYIAPRERTLTQTSIFEDREIKIAIETNRKNEEDFYEWEPVDTVREDMLKEVKTIVQQVNDCVLVNDWEGFKRLFHESIDTEAYRRKFDNAVKNRRSIEGYAIRNIVDFQSAKHNIVANNIAEVEFGMESDWKKSITKRSGNTETVESVDCLMKTRGSIEIIKIKTTETVEVPIEEEETEELGTEATDKSDEKIETQETNSTDETAETQETDNTDETAEEPEIPKTKTIEVEKEEWKILELNDSVLKDVMENLKEY